MRILCCECILAPSSGNVRSLTNLVASAASALAANSILRSSAGAGFPLFATYMVRETP